MTESSDEAESENVPLGNLSQSVKSILQAKGIKLKEFIPKPNVYENNSETEFDLVSPTSVEKDPRKEQVYICDFAIKNPKAVKIYRTCFDKRSNRDLFSLYKFDLIDHSKTTLTFSNGKKFKKHEFCIRQK